MRTFNFMKYKSIWFSISGIILIIGLIFGIVNGGLNFGIEYTGGSSITIKFDKSFDLEKVRTVMLKYDDNVIVTYAGNQNELALIKTNVDFDVPEQGEIKNDFKENLGVEETNIEFAVVGPSIGDQLLKQAVIALLLALISILIYVSIRFEWRFGVASVVALFHDIGIMFAVYAIFQIPATSSFLAALLTIIGYSINDTIVIFDRIRENVKNNKKMSDDVLVNVSVSQTLVRTINTSVTTLVTILALYILGVPAIRDFALPMMVGVLSGCYSTVFIASPIWVLLRKKFNPAASH